MEVAPEAVEVPEAAPRRSFWSADNRLVRAVGRIPLPLGAKLLIGFAVVAALLALVAALGLVALGQSNSRGEQLRNLQQTTAYARVLEAEANMLNTLVHDRRAGPNLSLSAYQAEDNDILTVWSQFFNDVQYPNVFGSPGRHLSNSQAHVVKSLQTTLTKFQTAWGNVLASDETEKGHASQALALSFSRAAALGSRAINQSSTLANLTAAQSDTLVSANHGGFVKSRNLLIGVGSGSLLLALALGLLLSWSVVSPLRRTQGRLAEIAGGDFGSHVDVANRDEIGALAADVNRMNDELESLYGELETASRHKSDFLATMSHELRTPLNAIIGFSEILREQMFGELNERQLAYVNDVIGAGQHLLSLINDVLDLAKIEAGRMELELSEVEVPAVLRSAISMHADRAERGGIVLGLTTEPAEITITADERRLRQIVFNLLSNAVKFTPDGGRVDVSARVDDGHVEIAVADTGHGIALEDQETIFEEFEQTADGKKAEGTGLGLPLSRKLVELHGGRLWIESEPGHGSTFRFTLPAEAAE